MVVFWIYPKSMESVDELDTTGFGGKGKIQEDSRISGVNN